MGYLTCHVTVSNCEKWDTRFRFVSFSVYQAFQNVWKTSHVKDNQSRWHFLCSEHMGWHMSLLSILNGAEGSNYGKWCMGKRNVVSYATSKSDKKSKSILAYLFLIFIKSIPPFPLYKYIGIQKISVHNEKWYLQLCNLLFPVRCWSENCSLVWNTLRQGQNKTPHCNFDV